MDAMLVLGIQNVHDLGMIRIMMPTYDDCVFAAAMLSESYKITWCFMNNPT